jgi:hypothetical protein
MLRTLLLLMVYATQATIKHFSDSVVEYDNELIHHPKFRHETQKMIDQTQSAIYAFTHPVVEPNRRGYHTIQDARRRDYGGLHCNDPYV